MNYRSLLYLTVGLFTLVWPPGISLAQTSPSQNSASRSETRANLTVSGYIKDASNGEGLIGVSVYVKELNTGSVTNSYGFYAITAPAGVYTLVISYVGYKKQTQTVALTDRNVQLNIELGEEGKQLQEVTVFDKTRR